MNEQNEKNRRMNPEEILEMFLEVVRQHASKSYDFPISNVSDNSISLIWMFCVPCCAVSADHLKSSKRCKCSLFRP